MRTTISMNDELLRQAKLRAAETHRTLTAVIEDAVRMALQQKPVPGPYPVRVPTSGSGGLKAGITLDDTSAVMDRMDGLD